MVNIKYIDNKYFCKTNKKSESIIIFQKNDDINDELCNVISERIDALIDETETNISLSAVHEVMKNFEFGKTIEKNMFICKENGNILFSYGLYPFYASDKIELFDSKDKKIATISIRKERKSKWFYGVCLFFAIFVVAHYVNSKLERDRIETNEMLYNKDITIIDSLKSDYYTAIERDNTYSDYLSSEESQAINHCLTYLISVANSVLESVEKDGDYIPIRINADSIRNEIKKMVQNAQESKYMIDEKLRKEGNIKAYNDNVSMIDNLLEYLQSKKNQNKVYEKFLNSKSLDEIEAELLRMKQLMKTHLAEAQIHDIYVQVPVDYDKFKSSIDTIFKITKENFTTNQKKIQEREKKQREKKQREKKRRSAFYTFVKKGDEDYKKYFYDKKNIAAARRSIVNYQNALNIMYQSSVEKRMKILQNELK